jgi:tRNA(fMet)-specific endonuclease VapC
MTYYLDTDTCVFVLRGLFPAIQEGVRAQTPDRIKIPAVVKAELLLGAQKASSPPRVKQTVEAFLAPYEIVPFSDACTVVYAAIRWTLEQRGQMIGANDLFIAATVLANQGTLVTHNTPEHKRIPGLLLQDWTKPL